jgi:hypothetical protein
VISIFVNVNRFSLRDVSPPSGAGFLGSARGKARTPDPFTGFDRQDNPCMATTQPQSEPTGCSRDQHDLNVVSTTNAAWQERRRNRFDDPRIAATATLGTSRRISRRQAGRITLGTMASPPP